MVTVIEGGRPDGTDLVIGEHHSNGVARAAAAGEKIVQVVELGDDFAMSGIRLMPAFSENREHLCVLLVIDAGKNSRLVGVQVIPTVIAEIGRISLVDLKAGISKALSPELA